jgi:hypothetical protein
MTKAEIINYLKILKSHNVLGDNGRTNRTSTEKHREILRKAIEIIEASEYTGETDE